MSPSETSTVQLRPVEPEDLPRIFAMQLDPESNRVAVTIPRSADSFDALWENALRDERVTARVILRDGVIVGNISCFQFNGLDSVGYWIDRNSWGRGIASRALELLLCEVTRRPLHAQVATSNAASLRILQKCGFEIVRIQISPATDRYLACEEALLILR